MQLNKMNGGPMKDHLKSSYELIADKDEEAHEDEDHFSYVSGAESQKSVILMDGLHRLISALTFAWKHTFGRIGEDWVFLALLGVIMAVISFLMDYGIATCNKARIWLSSDLITTPILQYMGWVSLPVCLILFSTTFTSLVAPQAAGSGIPEMKTILRGVFLKESLSFKALITKIIGLTATLGTGLPLGKEGPFVHIASMAATLLTKVVSSFSGIYYNKSRNYDMLASSCAVGVAAAFAAPIGGVLFSIEVTAVYFAVRNYWRGFFAAVCGSVMFRLMSVWVQDEETLTALFKTNFKVDQPFAPGEIVIFALLGVLSGLLGALFIWVHRKYSLFLKRNKLMKTLNKKSRLLYPFLVTLFYSTLTFPLGLGQFVAGELTTHQQVAGMFSNFSWTNDDLTVSQYNIVSDWMTPWTGIFLNLFFYAVFTFFGTIVACTVPVPAGIFVPVFKIGAAIGRMVGECMAVIFSSGIYLGSVNQSIMPGGYAIVGAAALVGAVTHTVSTSVIAFELTGQITHSIPIVIAVLIANAVCQGLQPSIFDSIIQMKKLPYLPDIITSTTGVYDTFVEVFMERDVKFVWYGINYRELKALMLENMKLRTFPVVDSSNSMILLGSVRQKDLFSLLEAHLGEGRKAKFFKQWTQMAECELEMEMEAKRAKENNSNDEEDGQETPTLRGTSFNESTRPMFHIDDSVTSSMHDILKSDSENDQLEELQEKLEQLQEDQQSEKPPCDLPPKETTSTSTTPPVNEVMERRKSRFSVTKVESPVMDSPRRLHRSKTMPLPQVAIVESINEKMDSNNHLPSSANTTITHGTQPPKGILKKTKSFVFQPQNPNLKSFSGSPYATIHTSENIGPLRQAISTLKKAKSLVGMDAKASQLTFSGVSRADLPVNLLIDKLREYEKNWEERELDEIVDFSVCRIDPSPNQLVERTNLMKVHFMFSMMNLNHAYVTAIGRLIGVVSLTGLRHAIEKLNAGEFVKQDTD